MNISVTRASSFCEEFSDYVLYDEYLKSVLFNVQEEYFPTVFRELSKLGYILVFKTKFNTTNSLTCTFIKE